MARLVFSTSLSTTWIWIKKCKKTINFGRRITELVCIWSDTFNFYGTAVYCCMVLFLRIHILSLLFTLFDKIYLVLLVGRISLYAHSLSFSNLKFDVLCNSSTHCGSPCKNSIWLLVDCVLCRNTYRK